ncbi:hypothetical protein JOE57_002292 [Microlunatus panaciterrae]|uniref:Uncharacterized protein n=1 Tax=Microlunatus panaciterrae TaxID=400768 RepID=A0ABS2RK37_9ACTN|nr:hypothetical protein [Microlunatus panaciterrae]MBM7799371.1 hypothetical protein [Microlunatus panaciterrae]
MTAAPLSPPSVAPMFGPYGVPALRHADRFVDLGADSVWFHGFDSEAFELCARHEIRACVEFPTFRADLDAQPELTPIGVDGLPIRHGDLVQGVCLSRREFLAEVEDRLVAGLSRYQPAGVWLDYLSGAGWFETPEPDLQESCFCADCLADFGAATGIDTSPAQIVARHGEAWTAHQCDRVARFGAHYSALIRDALPGCVVGAYMCPWTPDEYGGALRRVFAQDHALLAPSIDVFTPLVYATKSGRPASWGREVLEASADFVPADRVVQLIGDALDGPAALREMADASRPSWGLQVFSGFQLFEDEELGDAFRATATLLRERLAAAGG